MDPVWKSLLRRWAPWLALAAGALAACQTVPYTGRSQLLLIPASEEKNMGLKAYNETLKKANLSNDPEKVAMV
ncbi:MAG: M48 family peptidase, partial [Elusimicrobiota bacterium]